MRIYDARVGRFLSLDPITKEYPELSPYQFSSNRPIDGIDRDGLEYSPARGPDKGVPARDETAVKLYPVNPLIINPTAEEGKKKQMQQIMAALAKQTPPTVSKKEPFRSELEKSDFQAAQERNFTKLGYNPDGSKPFLKRLDDNKYVQAFAANVFLPLLDGYTYLSGGGGLLKGGIVILERQAVRTGGRIGSMATRTQVAEIAVQLESRGYTITGGGGRFPEEYLKPISGRKGGSYIDLTATHPEYGTLRINTVDVYQSGLPTKRELQNAARIRTQINSNEHLLLIPK